MEAVVRCSWRKIREYGAANAALLLLHPSWCIHVLAMPLVKLAGLDCCQTFSLCGAAIDSTRFSIDTLRQFQSIDLAETISQQI